MTIPEILEKRRLMEEAIRVAMRTFEEETGLVVDGINVERGVASMGVKIPPVRKVETQVILP